MVVKLYHALEDHQIRNSFLANLPGGEHNAINMRIYIIHSIPCYSTALLETKKTSRAITPPGDGGLDRLV